MKYVSDLGHATDECDLVPEFSKEPTEPTLYQQIGARIRLARIRSGLTQAALSRRIGLSRPAVANIEAGKQQILVHTLVDIAQATRTTVGFLVGETFQVIGTI